MTILKFRTALVLGSVLITLAVLELGVRAVFGAPPPYLEPQVRHQPEAYGYKPIPNQRGVFTVDKPVVTNRYGFRDDDWAVPKPAGRTRVLVVGDSFTFGNDNRVEDIYPTVLRRALTSRFGPRVDVLNASAGGWDLDNEVAFLEQEGFGYEPDVVVIGFYVNDVLPPRRTLREAIAGDGRLDARPWWARAIPYSFVFAVKRSALISYVRMRLPVAVGPPSLDNLLLDNAVDLASHPAMRNARQLLVTLFDDCRRRQVDVVFAVIPPVNLYAHPRGSVKLFAELQTIVTGEGGTFVDLSAPFWDDRNPVRHYGSPWDNHFVASGHALAGGMLADAVAPIVARRLASR